MQSTQIVALKDEDFEVEFEVISLSGLPQSKTDERLTIVDARIAENEEKLDYLNAEIEKLTNHADGLDYAAAVVSGVLAGMVDAFFVGEFSLSRGKAWSNEKVNGFVHTLAEKTGYTGSDFDGAIRHLERYGIPSDSVTSQFGGGKQHHLRDFAHHPTLVGLCFSLVTQFTGMAYGTDTLGNFMAVPIKKREFIGKDFQEKIFYGVIYWFLHMASDMAGSNAFAGAGTGLPGPALSLVKELSALPVLKNSVSGEQLRVNISKLFNGTLLAQRDANGKIARDANGKPLIERFDLRAELGVLHELGKQAIPVIINEVMIRGFYFLRRLISEFKTKKDFKEIDWKKTLPFKNRTIVRMLTISTGVLVAVDAADAAIRAAMKTGGTLNPLFWSQFALRINFVGIGRCIVACGIDIGMGIRRSRLRNERMKVYQEQIMLCNAKVFYLQANMWVAAKEAGIAVEGAYALAQQAITYFVASMQDTQHDMEQIGRDILEIKKQGTEKHLDFLKEMKDASIWG